MYVNSCIWDLVRWYSSQDGSGGTDIVNRFVDTVREERVRRMDSSLETIFTTTCKADS